MLLLTHLAHVEGCTVCVNVGEHVSVLISTQPLVLPVKPQRLATNKQLLHILVLLHFAHIDKSLSDESWSRSFVVDHQRALVLRGRNASFFLGILSVLVRAFKIGILRAFLVHATLVIARYSAARNSRKVVSSRLHSGEIIVKATPYS